MEKEKYTKKMGLGLFRRGDIILYAGDDKLKKTAMELCLKLKLNFKEADFQEHAAVASGDLSMIYQSVHTENQEPGLVKTFWEPRPGYQYTVYRYKGLCYNPSDIVDQARAKAVNTYQKVIKAIKFNVEAKKIYSDRLKDREKIFKEKQKELLAIAPGDLGDPNKKAKFDEIMKEYGDLYLRIQNNIKTIRTNDNSLVDLERQLVAAYRQEEEARAQEEQDILSTRVQNRIGDMAQGYQNLSETGRLRNEVKKLPYNDQIKKLQNSSLYKNSYHLHDDNSRLLIDEVYNNLCWSLLDDANIRSGRGAMIPDGFGRYESNLVPFALSGHLHWTKDQWSKYARTTFICSTFAARSVLAASQLFRPQDTVNITEKPLHDRFTPMELGQALDHDIYWDRIAVIGPDPKEANEYIISLPCLPNERRNPKTIADIMMGELERDFKIPLPKQAKLWDLKTWKSNSSVFGARRDSGILEIDGLLENFYRSKALRDPDFSLQCRYLVDLAVKIEAYLQANPQSNRKTALGELAWQVTYELFTAAAQNENVVRTARDEREKLEKKVKTGDDMKKYLKKSGLY
jgi:hypothetical protein